MNILVVGGAGYIGSHMVKQLSDAGHTVFVLDNLTTGFRELAKFGELIVGHSPKLPSGSAPQALK